VVLHALLCRDESVKVVEARGVAQKA
jgi:hypothetical protein